MTQISPLDVLEMFRDRMPKDDPILDAAFGRTLLIDGDQHGMFLRTSPMNAHAIARMSLRRSLIDIVGEEKAREYVLLLPTDRAIRAATSPPKLVQPPSYGYAFAHGGEEMEQ